MKFQNPFVDCLCACAVTPEFIEKCADAGVAAINKCICTDESMYQAIKEICNYREFIEKHSDIAMLVRRPEDIEEAYRQHKVGIMMGFQGTLPLEYDVRLADIYADAGVTIIQLTYNYRNLVGSGNMENNLVGLSEFGYEVIERLNKAGVLVDLSHACEQTQLEAAADDLPRQLPRPAQHLPQRQRRGAGGRAGEQRPHRLLRLLRLYQAGHGGQHPG